MSFGAYTMLARSCFMMILGEEFFIETLETWNPLVKFELHFDAAVSSFTELSVYFLSLFRLIGRLTLSALVGLAVPQQGLDCKRRSLVAANPKRSNSLHSLAQTNSNEKSLAQTNSNEREK